jgi:predicted GNAT family acetyltransferase
MKNNNLSRQFHVTHDKLDKGSHSLTLSNMDSRSLARVSFDNYTNDDGNSQIDIDYLKSHHEGKGHAKALMQHLYDRYPNSNINWGLTIHPAATHLASQFEGTYPNRTDYEQNHDEYVEGTEGMYSGEPGY